MQTIVADEQAIIADKQTIAAETIFTYWYFLAIGDEIYFF
jgi:hypothetical protein